MTVVAIRLVDRVGRRALLIGGMSVMIIGLAALAVSFGIGVSGSGAVFATIALAVYVGAFAVSLGPVAWLLIAEIFPLRVRGQAASVATMSNWAANLVVAVSYLSIIAAIGEVGTFSLYAGITALSLVYVILEGARDEGGRSQHHRGRAGPRSVRGGGPQRSADLIRAVPHAPPGHPHEGLADDVVAHLRLAPFPLHEGDGHLDHPVAGADGPGGQIDLEAVSLRGDVGVVDALAAWRGGRRGNRRSRPAAEAPAPRASTGFRRG